MARISQNANQSKRSSPLDQPTRVVAYKYVKHQKLLLKTHPQFNEKWVQEKIAEDPSIIGIGELIPKDKERNQPGAGRLDLLFQDPDSNLRYEVEIQLGKTKFQDGSLHGARSATPIENARSRIRPQVQQVLYQCV